MPGRDILPETLKRSPHHAQSIFIAAYDNAIEEYKGDEATAHKVAWAAVEHKYEKSGDHWTEKAT